MGNNTACETGIIDEEEEDNADCVNGLIDGQLEAFLDESTAGLVTALSDRLSEQDMNALYDCHQAAVVRYARVLIDDGRDDIARELLLSQDRFILKSKAIDVDIKSGDYNAARRTIGLITPANQSESDYLQSQLTYVEYLDKKDQFVLTTEEYERLVSVGNTHDHLAPYTRGVLSLLTGVILRPELPTIPDEVETREAVNQPTPIAIVSPNPFSEMLEIEVRNLGDVSIEVYLLDGRMILQQQVATEKVAIPTHTWEAGVYIVQVANGDGYKNQMKLIKY